MPARCPRISALLTSVFCVVVGWMLASFRPAALQASGGDRLGESAVTAGPVLVRYDDATKSSMALEAIYLLDYKRGRLLATIPGYRQTATATHVVDAFLERDLVSDFKLDLDTGPRPHFLMTTGSLGPYSSGWAPLFVFEMTTSQLGVYRLQVQQTIGAAMRPQFELLELRPYAKGTAQAQR